MATIDPSKVMDFKDMHLRADGLVDNARLALPRVEKAGSTAAASVTTINILLTPYDLVTSDQFFVTLREDVETTGINSVVPNFGSDTLTVNFIGTTHSTGQVHWMIVKNT